MAKRLTGAARDAIRALVAQQLAQGATWRDVAEANGLTKAQAKHIIREAKALNDYADVSPTADDNATYLRLAGGDDDDVPRPTPFVSADQQRARLRAYLGTTFTPSPFYFSAPRTVRQVAAVGDFHSRPDPAVLAALVRSDPDVLVIGGDMFDNQYASRHPSETRREHRQKVAYGLQDEMAANRAALELLLEETRADIRVMRGNHDQWPLKTVVGTALEWLVEVYRDPLETVVDALGERVQLVGFEVRYRLPSGHTVETGHDNEFMYVLDDVLFSHLNFTTSQTETGVSKLYRHWFSKWRLTLGLADVRVFVHFHVHSRNLQNVDGGHITLIEPGMGGTPAAEGYKHSYQQKWRPSVQGMVRFMQYQQAGGGWRTDSNSIELIAPHLGLGQASKRESAA